MDIRTLTISGGGAGSDDVCQLTADMFGLPVVRAQTYETSGLGAAICGFVGLGHYSNFDNAISKMVHHKEHFIPNLENTKIYEDIYKNIYKRHYFKLRKTYKTIKKMRKQFKGEEKMAKAWKGFRPDWQEKRAPAGSYREISKWGQPEEFKVPKETLYKVIKETFKLTDDDFKTLKETMC